MAGLDYRSAGVDLDVYEKAMKRLPSLMEATKTPGVMGLPGGFAGLFHLGAMRDWKDPVLVSGTDGVGTKLRVAIDVGVYSTVGIDLVAMCVNDCLCLGATPLFFLDYIAMDADNPELLEQLVQGISQGCIQSGAALLGGETAIMPDMYAVGDFDLSGFCVGAAERAELVNGRQRILPGDVVIGLPSSGFHSNGYSLIRKAVFERAGLRTEDRLDQLDGQTVGEVLLTPTRIYADQVSAVFAAAGNQDVHGIAHVTGGGIAENLERILPTGVSVALDRDTWNVPKVFDWVQQLGEIAGTEMDRVFNMGLGLILIVPESRAEQVRAAASTEDYGATIIGHVVASSPESPGTVQLSC
ncbi:MAG: phosphoribosylformylglycinamidine cyclo-ligase [Planctomycetaceae bacterium]